MYHYLLDRSSHWVFHTLNFFKFLSSHEVSQLSPQFYTSQSFLNGNNDKSHFCFTWKQLAPYSPCIMVLLIQNSEGFYFSFWRAGFVSTVEEGYEKGTHLSVLEQAWAQLCWECTSDPDWPQQCFPPPSSHQGFWLPQNCRSEIFYVCLIRVKFFVIIFVCRKTITYKTSAIQSLILFLLKSTCYFAITFQQ